MTTKFKILSSISFIALAIVLTFVGVWALTDLDFVVGGNITYTAPKPKIDLQQDANGFYVTMGTYEENPVVWRLVGLDGEKFTGTTAPTSGTGTFIIETTACSAITSKFMQYSYISADYATSVARSYLNGDYITTLNLADDAIYNSITPRDMQSLYADIGWNTSGEDSNYAKNAIYSIETTETGSDKLWFMSVAEVYTMLGGGTIGTDNVVPSTWSDEVKANCVWDAESSSGYWARSFGTSNPAYPYYIGNGGSLKNSINIATVRPAFNLEF